MTGQSVGVRVTPADDRNIFGLGVSSQDLLDLHGYSPFTIGGTLVGPPEGDTGDWAAIPAGNLIGGKPSPVCKSCLQSCRSGLRYAPPKKAPVATSASVLATPDSAATAAANSPCKSANPSQFHILVH